jgi:hypothetical protein
MITKTDHLCFIAAGNSLEIRSLKNQSKNILVSEPLVYLPLTNIWNLKVSLTGRLFTVAREDNDLIEVNISGCDSESQGLVTNFKKKIIQGIKNGTQVLKNIGFSERNFTNMFGRMMHNRNEYKISYSQIEIDDTKGILYHLRTMMHSSGNDSISEIDVYDMIYDRNSLKRVMTIQDTDLINVITQRHRISHKNDNSTWNIVSISAVTSFDHSKPDLVVYYSNGYLAYISIDKEPLTPMSHMMNSLYSENRKPMDSWFCMDIQNPINPSSIAKARSSLSNQVPSSLLPVSCG